MKYKDTKFDIFGTEWSIKYIDKIDQESNDTFCLGRTNYSDHTILISKKNLEGDNITNSEIKITLLHEIVHAILGTGQYNTASNDEPLVEWLARCIKSLLDQKII